MQDPRISAVKNLKLDSVRINRTPPIIFLCGGAFGDHPDRTVRGRLREYLKLHEKELHNSVTVAEDYQDWLNDSVYADLAQFETDIGGISSLVVVILESAGSLVEVGLFINDKVLQDKLVFIINQSHFDSTSFIRLGPIRQLQSIDTKRVLVYDWPINCAGGLDYEVPNALGNNEIKEFADDLRLIINNQNKTEKLSTTNIGHLALLTLELILIFIALTKAEISDLLFEVFKSKLTEKEISRIIFLLKKFDLTKSISRGHFEFFLIKHPDILPRASTPGLIRTAANIDAIAYYSSKNNSVNTKRRMIISQGASL